MKKPMGALISCLLVTAATAEFAAEEGTEIDALAALNEFIEAWNMGDNAELRKTLNYPFLTLFRPGQLEISKAPEDFTTNFQRMRDQDNWARSTFDESKVVASADDQVHVEVTYSRHNSKGERYQTGRVYYIVTKQNEHWGMQFRSGIPPGEADSDAERAAHTVIDKFFTAWNGADNEAMHNVINFPHAFIVRDGRAAIADTPQSMVMNFQAMREREGWHKSEYHGLEFIHASADKVIAQLTFTRHHEDGSIYRTVPVLWIITKQDAHWGIQLRAILGAV